MMNLENQKSVDKALVKFSDALVPTDEFLAEGKKAVDKVFKLMQERSKFDVARVFIGGSVGKHTDVISPDFDCVLLINDEQPLFDAVIQDLEDILILGEFFEVSDLHNTKYAVQFTLPGGFTVDLLPAANLVKDNSLGGAALAEAQRSAVLDQIRRHPNQDQRIYSSSLVESQIEFMRTMDSFSHQLARLAKYWYKTLYFGEYVPGGKTIVELIAVAAAEHEQGRDRSMLNAFRRFLDKVSSIDNLKLAFVRNPNGKWESTETFPSGYPRSARANFIIEPANPYNDMVEPLAPGVVKKFMEFSEITKSRFANVTDLVKKIGSDNFLLFDVLFEPLPKILRLKDFNFKMPESFICGASRNFRSFNPDMKVHNEEVMKIPGMPEFLRAVKIYLFSTIHSVVHDKPQITLPEVQDRVAQMVDENIHGVAKKMWVPVHLPNKDWDVSLTFPITVGSAGIQEAVVLQFKYNL